MWLLTQVRLISVARHNPMGISLIMRMAVYADDGGVPGAKVADSASNSNPGGGWLTLDADSVLLSAGDYWIAFMINDGPGGALTEISYSTVDTTDSYSATATFGEAPQFFPDDL